MKNHLILLFLLYGLSIGIRAQQPVWQNISVDQGLPDPNVTSFVKIKEGKLYVGTAIGLYSYDGYEFRKLPVPSFLKINPYINTLSYDGHYIYAGIRDALLKFDPFSDKVYAIKNTFTPKGGVGNLCINRDSSKLYAASHDGLMTVNIESGNFTKELEIPIHGVLSIEAKADESIIVYTVEHKFFKIEKSKINELYSDKDIRYAIWWEKEKCWIVAKSDGLYSLKPEHFTLKKLRISLSFNQIENQLLYSDSRENIWVNCGTRLGYLESVDDKSLHFSPKETTNSFTITSNTAQAFYIDEYGTTWVGGDGTGISYLTKPASKILFFPNEKAGVEHFWMFNFLSKTNELFCGTSHGLWIGKLIDNEVIGGSLIRPKGLERFSVNGMADLNDREWVLSVYKHGFWIMNKKTFALKPFKRVNQLVETPYVFGLKPISNNRLVLNTQYSGFILNRQNLEVSKFDQSIFKNFPTFTAYEDSKNRILLGGGFGIQVFDKSLIRQKYFSGSNDSSFSLSSNVIFDFFERSDTSFLIGTMGGGLCSWNILNDQFISKHLVTNPVNIYGIMPVDKKKMLITTSNGLCRYDPVSEKSVMLNISNTLPFNDFNQSAFYYDGIRYFLAGEKGFLLINKTDIKDVFEPNEEIRIWNNLALANNLVLKPGQQSLNLKFTLSNFYPVKKISYQYQIHGIDSEKRILPAGANQLIYNYLPPGNYKLVVELIDETGFLTAKPRELSLVVKPLFYQSTWFKIVIGALIILIIFLTVRYLSFIRLRWKLQKLDSERKVSLERSRISRELHDNLGSQLTYLISGIETTGLLLKRNKVDKTAENLDKLQLAARESMQQLRDSIWALNPGFMTLQTLSNQTEQWFTRLTEPYEQLKCTFNQANCPDFKIDPLIGLNIFRIIQEAVHNSLKHSEASELILLFNCDDKTFCVSVIDNGKGIDPNISYGTGLNSITQRAEGIHARITIGPERGTGTVVKLIALKNMLKG